MTHILTQQTKRLAVISLCLWLVACSTNTGRYQQANDSTPTRLPTTAELKDATPRVEAKSRGGNKNYTVRGKHYQVLASAKGFTQTGIASWYGKKFHGHLTSNGEIYDMYAMSAAHKHLPLPTYLKVTNLSNNKSVVVRVNDRGPFHQSRIIDLSYSAAYKLDMLKTGTAEVSIETITAPVVASKAVKSNAKITKTTPNKDDVVIQVFATKDKAVAQKTAALLTKQFKHKVIVPEDSGLYRVQLGPFDKHHNTDSIISTLKRSGYPNAYRRKILQ